MRNYVHSFGGAGAATRYETGSIRVVIFHPNVFSRDTRGLHKVELVDCLETGGRPPMHLPIDLLYPVWNTVAEYWAADDGFGNLVRVRDT